MIHYILYYAELENTISGACGTLVFSKEIRLSEIIIMCRSHSNYNFLCPSLKIL